MIVLRYTTKPDIKGEPPGDYESPGGSNNLHTMNMKAASSEVFPAPGAVNNESKPISKAEKRNARRRAWYSANAEKERARSAAYQKAHPEKQKASDSAYYARNSAKKKASRVARYHDNPEKERAKAAKYRKEHPEKVKARVSTWRKANKDKTKAYNVMYRAKNEDRLKAKASAREAARYKENPEKIKARVAAYNKKYPERVKARTAAYYKAHPEMYRKHALIRRARKKNATIGDTAVITKWEKSWRSKKAVPCYYCSRRFDPKKCHADHIIALATGGTHSVDNLCISCATCNLRKREKTLSEWNARLEEPLLL